MTPDTPDTQATADSDRPEGRDERGERPDARGDQPRPHADGPDDPRKRLPRTGDKYLDAVREVAEQERGGGRPGEDVSS